MATRRALMVSWAQTRIDGSPARPQQVLAEGMTWRWQGRALPLEGDGAALMLSSRRDEKDLRAHAARVVRKLLKSPAPSAAELCIDEDEDTLMAAGFIVSDGQEFYPALPIPLEDGGSSIILFPERVPAPDRDHVVVSVSPVMLPDRESTESSVICFTPGTRVRTPDGDVLIEDLGCGDMVLTRDDGPQEVVWSGHRRMSGARLFALPQERPVRIRAGALGIDRPDGDLVVSPDHRILMAGAAARDLFDTSEVLVRAGDLVGDRGVTIDHSLRETCYIHLMFERHQVIWANGLEVESFHPRFMELEQLSPLQRDLLFESRPDLAFGCQNFGDPVRRMLTRAESAIMMQGARVQPVAAQPVRLVG